MYISLNWLSDFVDIDGLGAEIVAERLTVGCAEVENVIPREIPADRAFVARIVEVSPSASDPEIRHLTLDVGERGSVTLATRCVLGPGRQVAWAPESVRSEKKVPRISDPFTQGLLVSMLELGLAEDESPIICPDDARPGTPLSQWLPATDTLIEIDNKSVTHRPDLWGHYGFARELSAILQRPLRP
ncbi:MAG: phenylalanine--tRNA ligase subunit beta, partial [Pseudomonadota bacterium]